MRLFIKTIILLFIFVPFHAYGGEKRAAKPGEGVVLNQKFVYLEDGRVWGSKQETFLPLSKLMSKEEAGKHMGGIIQRLNKFRYWNDGVPPNNAFERYKDAERKRQEYRKMILQDNWAREGRFSKPSALLQGG